MSEPITVSEHALNFVCGFCGQRCMFDMAPASGGSPILLHYMPMCPDFDRLDPDTFLFESGKAHDAKGTHPVTGEPR